MAVLTAVALVAAACASEDPLEGPADPVEAAHAFERDPFARRDALEASVAVADTEYGRLRLSHYSLTGAGIDAPDLDWDATEVIDYAVRPLVAREVGAPAPTPGTLEPVADLTHLSTVDDYVAAGRRAFERYPMHVEATLRDLRDADTARASGLVVQEDGTVHGAVELELSGLPRVGLTCAACHDAPRPDGQWVEGASNAQLRFAELMGAPIWRPGTMDVTADGIDNPVRPSDLRVIGRQERLHHTGNLANGRLARMVRIETLMAGRHEYRGRPDRRLVAALSLYLDSLAGDLPRPAGDGRARFESSCGACHRGDAMAGGIVAVSLVGTDPLATVGSTRATGGYRAPSLLGVGDRDALLHDGTAPGLLALLGLAPSAHVGHPFGRDLDEADRRAIAAYLGAR